MYTALLSHNRPRMSGQGMGERQICTKEPWRGSDVGRQGDVNCFWPETTDRGYLLSDWRQPIIAVLFFTRDNKSIWQCTTQREHQGGPKKATFSWFTCDHLTLRAHNIWTVWPILMSKEPIVSVFQGLQWRKKICRFFKYANGDVAADSMTRLTEKWTK